MNAITLIFLMGAIIWATCPVSYFAVYYVAREMRWPAPGYVRWPVGVLAAFAACIVFAALVSGLFALLDDGSYNPDRPCVPARYCE
jgi:hypothetical protein